MLPLLSCLFLFITLGTMGYGYTAVNRFIDENAVAIALLYRDKRRERKKLWQLREEERVMNLRIAEEQTRKRMEKEAEEEKEVMGQVERREAEWDKGRVMQYCEKEIV
ncbi:hypothetical protein EX30DRAFT_374854 [Ascodesmis nigricans]|uniref:Uncharacterized protein n=1 Tax=Ascodesmis nigricans TaxID=341454 RepID=A0A4S2MJQ1_9PEZI|nr:hypothetical protein EX30DRAFT_374854 [Ascodesmis nigricans]